MIQSMLDLDTSVVLPTVAISAQKMTKWPAPPEVTEQSNHSGTYVLFHIIAYFFLSYQDNRKAIAKAMYVKDCRHGHGGPSK